MRCAALVARAAAPAAWPTPRAGPQGLLLSAVGPEAFARFLGTLPCRAGLGRALLALGLAGAAAWARRRPDAARLNCDRCPGGRDRCDGAWLMHAAGRLEQPCRPQRSPCSIKWGPRVWAGGLVTLGSLWRLGRRLHRRGVWPVLTAGFSWLAVCRGPRALAVALPLGWSTSAPEGWSGPRTALVSQGLLLGVAPWWRRRSHHGARLPPWRVAALRAGAISSRPRPLRHRAAFAAAHQSRGAARDTI